MQRLKHSTQELKVLQWRIWSLYIKRIKELTSGRVHVNKSPKNNNFKSSHDKVRKRKISLQIPVVKKKTATYLTSLFFYINLIIKSREKDIKKSENSENFLSHKPPDNRPAREAAGSKRLPRSSRRQEKGELFVVPRDPRGSLANLSRPLAHWSEGFCGLCWNCSSFRVLFCCLITVSCLIARRFLTIESVRCLRSCWWINTTPIPKYQNEIETGWCHE